jgi:hypothetical protein
MQKGREDIKMKIKHIELRVSERDYKKLLRAKQALIVAKGERLSWERFILLLVSDDDDS